MCFGRGMALQSDHSGKVETKPLEGKPATISRKSVTANANASGQWRRGFTMLNKPLFRGNSLSINESTAYLLIFNMFYTKQYFWIELFFKFTTKKKKSLTFCDRWDSFFWHFLFIPMVSINGDWVSHNSWLKFNDVKAVMWLVIKAHVIQVDRYAFSNGPFSHFRVSQQRKSS